MTRKKESNIDEVSDHSTSNSPATELVGFSCAHVHVTTALGFEPALQGSTVFAAKSQDTDVAFFLINANAACPGYSLLNARMFALADLDVRDLNVVETVYNIRDCYRIHNRHTARPLRNIPVA
jgi:hypothetical protein